MFDIKSSAANNNSSNNQQSNNDREPSVYWLNIGTEVEINGVKKFVSLPMGIPFDSLQVKPYKGNNTEYAEFVAIQTQLVNAIREQFVNIPAGESRKLESKQLVMELRHAAAPTETPVVPSLNLQFKLK